ncbi:hypothetical protein Bca4012_026106 [Brassica carinata]
MRLLRKSGLCPDRSISEYDQKNGEVPMSGRDHPSTYRSRSQPIGRWTKASSGRPQGSSGVKADKAQRRTNC